MKIPLIWLKDYVNIRKSPKEIAESFTALGLMLDKPIQKDVLDLEHRMDRSDWLSIIGCARDLSAMEGQTLKFPELNKSAGKQSTKDQIIEIRVECPEFVHRFDTRVFRGIKVKKSPSWLSERLELYGIPSINNIVDITNFVMVELGQPLHAQDLSKMEKPEIVIRRAKRDEEITTLLGQTLKLNPNNFVLTQNGRATVLGGIVGSSLTAVDENTTDIVLDAGNYDQVNIRRSSREHKIQNETVLRTDKFLHPKLCEIALERATKLILEIAGGEHYQNTDYYPKPVQPKKMKLRFSRIAQVSGMNISGNRVEMTLSSLDYEILSRTEDYIEVEVPYFRTDVEVEDDIVSDVLRINNYKNIPSGVMDQAVPVEITPKIYNFESRLKDIFVGLGLNEHITNPLTLSKKENETQIKLVNSFSSDKTALRTSLKPNLELLIENYKKHKIYEVGVFEIGRIYNKRPTSSNYSDYKEERKAQIVYANEKISPIEISKEIKRILSAILKSLEIFDETYKEYPGGTEILVNDLTVGQLEYNSILLDMENLIRVSKFPNRSRVETSINNYRTEDISMIVPLRQKTGGIFNTIRGFNPNIKNVEVVEEFFDSKLGSENKSVLIRIFYEGDLSLYKENLVKLLEAKYQVKVRS